MAANDVSVFAKPVSSGLKAPIEQTDNKSAEAAPRGILKKRCL